MQHLYTCKVTHMNTNRTVRAYTHAHSHKQALRFFCARYPYPPYVITEVKDTVTGVVME